MKKLFILTAAALCLVSCIEDSRNNNMVPDSVSLVFDDVVVPVSVYAAKHDISVLKSGKGDSAAWATIGFTSEGLAKYNADESNDGTYKELASNLVKFSTDRVNFQPSDVRQLLSVSWDVDDMVQAVAGDDYVVPIGLLKSDITVNEGRNLILLNILNSTASFASSGSTVVAKETANENGEVTIKFKLDHPIPEDLAVQFAVDNSLVDTYNTEKGTNYGTAPNGYVQIPAEGAVIPAGSSDVFATVTLKNSVLFGNDGQMLNFRTLVVPLKITGTSVNGVKKSEAAYYLLVNNPYAGASFSRIWGKYSTAGHLWMTDYGLPSGGDRDFAMDNDWVYLPYSVGGSTAKITAISINDPETTKLVNCTGFNTATITTACVRVIDKGNGTKMLIASGAGENTFPFYAWENGIDNPPTVYTLECTWRRGGDRIEFHGTWADGVLYTHAYQGRFTTRYKVVDGAFVSTDDGQYNGTSRALVNMLASDTGFGGFYKYPGQDQMIFATSDVSAFITIKDTYVNPGDGQKAWETDREEFPGADMTYGYNVFTYRGDKYIAYTAVDQMDQLKEDGITYYTTKQRARLVVVKDKGGFKASLLGDDKDIVFEAPIQGETFEDIAPEPPMSVQGDCAVSVFSDHVIIAAGVQGLGLSVFKME